MSVRATKRRGRDIWHVEVRRARGEFVFHRRRFLDRRRFRKVDAQAVEAELIAEFEAKLKGRVFCRGIDHPGEFTQLTGAVGFRQFADQYLAIQDPSRTDFRNKRRNVQLHLVPFFGDTPIEEISRMMIDLFRVRLRTTPMRRKSGRRSPSTINNILTTLRSILNLAYDYELIGRVPKVRKEPVAKQDPLFLTREEMGEVLAAVPKRWRPLVYTGLMTGLRRGELYELRWGDVQLEGEEPQIRVTRSVRVLGKKYDVRPTKGMRGRTVPLCRSMVRLLREIRPQDAQADGLVFSENGGYLSEKRLYGVVVKAGKKGLERRVWPHMLRHTFASWAYAGGVPPQVVQMWLGHADVVTTQRYAHLGPGAGRGLIAVLDGDALH